eukprot:Skav230249  [mRNA]  locus=scaffold1266:50096:54652:- [translate_table: standard]
MYVGTFYGPPKANSTLANGEEIFRKIAIPIVERALAFKGPALIGGDFNRTLSESPFWATLQAHGWVDAAMLEYQRFGTIPPPTCKDATRHSFILLNPALIRTMTTCHTVDLVTFDAHPSLEAILNVDTLNQKRHVWALPRTTDEYIFDDELLEAHANKSCEQRATHFEQAEQTHNVEELYRQFTLAFEETFSKSAVTSDGQEVAIHASCCKRYNKPLKRTMPMAPPQIPVGRTGDFNPEVTSPNSSIRMHVKQCRRIQSLMRQLKANVTKQSDVAHSQCISLWNCILNASGYRQNFRTWILTQLQLWVPTDLPDGEYLLELYNTLRSWVQQEIQQFRVHQQRQIKERMHRDIAKGGREAFRRVRDAANPPLAYIGTLRQLDIKPQRWVKGGLKKLRYSGSCRFVIGMPIIFQEQTVKLVDIQPEYIEVDKPLRCYDYSALVAYQHDSTAVQSEMQDIVADAWQTYWSRDVAPPDATEWSNACDWVTALEDCPSCPYQDFTIDSWKMNLRKANKGSARGSCGFSVTELLKMPAKLTHWLFALFRIAETDAKWPGKFGVARVVLLTKPDGQPNDAMGLRPITILSTIYRQWSSFRSQQVFEFLGSQLPPQIGNIAKHISSDMLAAWFADTLENSQFYKAKLCGLVIDLKKCYNLIPRYPLAKLMIHMGIPEPYVIAHQGLLFQLARYLELAGEIKDLHSSSTGVPEGCAFSVVSMLVLTKCAAEIIIDNNSDLDVSLFADNWGIISKTVAALEEAVARLEAFLHDMKMQVSPAKSWLWGTTTWMRNQLRQIQLVGQHPPIRNHAVDLGCDITYTRKTSKVSTKKRITKSKRMLYKIKSTKYPRAFRKKMSNTLGAGVMGYGSELVHVTLAEWRSIRTASCHAIDRVRSGANGLLVLSTTGEFIDPHLRNLCRRIKFMRKFFQQFPDKKSKFLHKVAHAKQHRTGLAAAFRKAFADVGWTCLDNGVLKHCSGFSFAWVTASNKFIQQILGKFWSYHVAHHLRTRKDFDINSFNGRMFWKLIKHRSERHQGVLTSIACGKHVTNDILHKYALHIHDDKCAFCGEPDSKKHRIFQCTGLREVRGRYTSMITWLRRQKQAIFAFALCNDYLDALQIKRKHQIPFPEMRLPTGDERVILFVDGSAYFQDTGYWEHCLASAAVVRWDPITQQTVLVCRGMVPGLDHSSFRGESFAILQALQHCRRCDIYGDCQAAMDLLDELIHTTHIDGVCCKFSHPDIWNDIAWHIRQRQQGDIRSFKVKAHQVDGATAFQSEKWMAFANRSADEHAKAVFHDECSAIFNAMNKVVLRMQAQEHMMYQYHSYICEIADKYFEHVQSKPRDESMVPDFGAIQPTCPCLGPFVIAPGTLEQWPFGPKFAQRFACWWNNLVWTNDGIISSLELYIDFAISSGSMVPVWLKQNKWALREDNIVADESSLALNLQSRTWVRVLQWMLPKIEFPINVLPKGRGLHHVGYTIPVYSFAGRPKLHIGTQASHVLWNYFHRAGSTVRDMKACWHPSASAPSGA